jgi:iron complex transport system substrate-binding protein
MKKILAILLSVAFAVSAAACANQETNQNAENSSSASSEVSNTSTSSEVSVSDNTSSNTAEDHYPVTITTHNYAKEEIEITFDKAPERVLAYSLNSVENMIALGLTDKILLAFSVEEDEVLPKYQEEFRKIKQTQSEFPTKEEALALQPDFILAWYSSFGEKRFGDVDFWHERGINTYMAYNSGLGDQSLENEYADILNLGKIFNVEEKAEALVDEMKAKVQKAQEYVKDKEPVNITILEDEGDVFRIYGYDTIGGDIAAQVGANLVTPTKNEKKSAEELVELNPEMIFSVHFGENSTSLNPTNCLDVFKNNPVYQNIDAVKNNKMYPTDLSLVYAPGVRVSESLDFFLEKLYPDMK